MNGDFDNGLRRFAIGVMNGVLRGIWGVKVSGAENIPRTGPLIVACNHVSLADPPVLNCGLSSARSALYLAKRELFDIPVAGRFFLATGVVPLERAKGDLGAMRIALDRLRAGGSVAIFPEGTRVRPGQAREPRTGVSFLSARSGAPVVPARLVNTDRFPFAFPLELRFGAPLPPAPAERAEALPYARAVMEAIRSL